MTTTYYPYMMPDGYCNVLHAVNLADAMDELSASGEHVLFCEIKHGDEHRLWDVTEEDAERIFCKYYNSNSGYNTSMKLF